MSTPLYSDLHKLEEDKRIEAIGKTVMQFGKEICFIVDSTPGKAERYIEKLLKRFPGIKCGTQTIGPVANTITVKVSPPSPARN